MIIDSKRIILRSWREENENLMLAIVLKENNKVIGGAV